MAGKPYTVSRPVPRDPGAEYVHDRLFRVDRRCDALTIDPSANNYVRTVSDDDDSQFRDAIEAAGADLLGQQFPYTRAGFVRHTLRPASQGAGRDRWR